MVEIRRKTVFITRTRIEVGGRGIRTL